MNNSKFKKEKGYTLVEIMFSIAIIILILGAVTAFQSDIFSFNRILQTNFLNQQDAKKIIKPLANEVRGAINSALGSYPIEYASDHSLTFYTDITGDNLAEKVKYYVDDGTLTKSFIEPEPGTYEYLEENEKIIKIINNVVEDEIFEYYDSSYDGSTSTSALEEPIVPSEIRMIKITVKIGGNPDQSEDPYIYTTQVSLRNLKENS